MERSKKQSQKQISNAQKDFVIKLSKEKKMSLKKTAFLQ